MRKVVLAVIGIILFAILLFVGQVVWGFYTAVQDYNSPVNPQTTTETDPDKLLEEASPQQRSKYATIKSQISSISRMMAIYYVEHQTYPPCDATAIDIAGLSAKTNASGQCILTDQLGTEYIYSNKGECAKLSTKSNLSDNMYINENVAKPIGNKDFANMDLCE